MNVNELIDRLNKSLDESIKIKEIQKYHHDWTTDPNGDFPFLFAKAKNFIKAAYGEKSDYYLQSVSLTKEDSYTFVWNKSMPLINLNNLKRTVNFLKNVLEEIDQQDLVTSSQVSQIEKKNPTSNKVFIVHGRNMSWLDEIEFFIKSLGYSPIILYKDINPGHTIIEKLESHADAFAAIVLLTPDDKGYLIEDDKSLKTRARQNVVFEYGYFAGVIGRKSIIIIDFGVEEKPSDINGVVYTNTTSDSIEKAKHEISIGLTRIKNNVNIPKAVSVDHLNKELNKVKNLIKEETTMDDATILELEKINID